MENQNFYEGRILVNMAASVMRQDDLKPLHGNLDWERLFRVADYNKISNLSKRGNGGGKLSEAFFS